MSAAVRCQPPSVTITDVRPTIRPESRTDHYAVEEMTRDAFWRFWGDETVCHEPLLVSRLRECDDLVPELNLVAELDGQIVGHIIYTRSKVVAADGVEHPTLTFGPLTVRPELQGRGIGPALMHASFGIARELGHLAVVLFGHADYYPRFGFRPAGDFGITTVDGHSFDALLALPLFDGALDDISGAFHEAAVFHSLNDADAVEFDKRFPPKPPHVRVPISVLLDRLPPVAAEALAAQGVHTVDELRARSQRELASLPGMDDDAIATVRTLMDELGYPWGTRR